MSFLRNKMSNIHIKNTIFLGIIADFIWFHVFVSSECKQILKNTE